MAKIRKDDEVIVIAGKDKGKQGKVLKVFPKKDSLIIENVNMVKKTVKKSDDYPNGGLIDIEKPIHISNVMLYCPENSKGVRVGYTLDKNGKKVRTAKGIDYIFDK